VRDREIQTRVIMRGFRRVAQSLWCMCMCMCMRICILCVLLCIYVLCRCMCTYAYVYMYVSLSSCVRVLPIVNFLRSNAVMVRERKGMRSQYRTSVHTYKHIHTHTHTRTIHAHTHNTQYLFNSLSIINDVYP